MDKINFQRGSIFTLTIIDFSCKNASSILTKSFFLLAKTGSVLNRIEEKNIATNLKNFVRNPQN